MGGMFQKAQSQALWESQRPTPRPCTRRPVSLHSPGVRFLHQGNLGGSLQGCPVGTSSPQLCVCYPSWASWAGLGCQGWPHTQGLGVGLFSESGCPVMGDNSAFSLSDTKELYNYFFPSHILSNDGHSGSDYVCQLLF